MRSPNANDSIYYHHAVRIGLVRRISLHARLHVFRLFLRETQPGPASSILDFGVSLDVGARQIIYTSGSGVYGENPSVAFHEGYGPCKPISTYGASKLGSEALLAAYCHMFGMIGKCSRGISAAMQRMSITTPLSMTRSVFYFRA
jgi:hypothetical protein